MENTTVDVSSQVGAVGSDNTEEAVSQATSFEAGAGERQNLDALLKAAGADFEVVCEPVMIKTATGFAQARTVVADRAPKEDGTLGESMRNFYAVRRTDNDSVFSIRGDRYSPRSTLENAEIARPLVDAGQAEYTSCNVYDGGATSVVSVKLKDTVEVAGEQLGCNMHLATSHDSSVATGTYLSVTRGDTVITAGITAKKALRAARQTRNSNDKLAMTDSAVADMRAAFAGFVERAEKMAATEVSAQELNVFLAKILPSKGEDAAPQVAIKRDQIATSFAKNGGNTRWDLFCAVASFTGKDLRVHGNNAAARQYQLHFGRGAKLQADAVKLLSA